MSKLLAYGCCFLAAAAGARAQKEDVQTEVVIRVSAAGNIPIRVLIPAKWEAAALLRNAGIKARWETTASRSPRELRECSGSVAEIVDVLVKELGAKDDHPGALGYSLPFARSGMRAVVFYDRVAGQTTKANSTILGFAMAHEIGHVLRGTDSHNQSGVMRDHWDERDYSQMAAHALNFAADDADSMRSYVARKARYCAAASMGTAAKEPTAEE